MKKRLACLILALLMLSSCGTVEESPEISCTDIPEEVVIVKPDTGKIVTLLDEAVKITECEFVENPPNYVHNPPVFFEGNTMYIYKFPAFTAIAGMTMADAAAYMDRYLAETTEFTYEIEVYADPASSQPSEIITLQGLNSGRVDFYQLFKYGDSLILFGKENAAEERLLYRYEFAMDGSLLSREPLTGVPEFSECYPAGKYVFCLDTNGGRTSMNHQIYDLHRFDRETGGITVADERGVILLFESAGGLYCLTPGEESDELILSSVGEDGFTEIMRFTTDVSNLNSAEYDADRQILYCTDYKNLYTVHADDGVTRKILFTGDYSICTEGITGDWILVRNGGYAITAYHQPEEKISLEDGQEVLRIYSDTEIYNDNILRTMNLSGFNLTAAVTEIDDTAEYSNTMAKKLLAGDSDFDIFYVSTKTSELLKGQYYEDLSRYPILTDYFDSMRPGAEKLCTVDGIKALVPWGVYTFCMAADTSVSSLNPHTLRTWDDILESKEAMNLSDDECIMAEYSSQNLVRSTFELLITNYMRDVIDDEQARADLDKLYRMAMEFDSDPFFDVVKEDGFRTPFLKSRQNHGVFAKLYENETPIFSPGMTDEYKQSWTGSFWAINPNSRNKELAAAYLAYFIEDCLGMPGGSDLFDREPISGPIVESSYDQEMFALYCDQLENGVLAYELPDFTGYFNRQFADIKSGKLTLEQAADDLFRWMRMLKFE
ncbi:MAG: hypothetical protein IJF78_04625 [Clostridia bacterium]|nr:hypothetical protein [Clostridia bacterium]